MAESAGDKNRIAIEAIVELLKSDPWTTDLLEKITAIVERATGVEYGDLTKSDTAGM